jgi:hypothetical protein
LLPSQFVIVSVQLFTLNHVVPFAFAFATLALYLLASLAVAGVITSRRTIT